MDGQKSSRRTLTDARQFPRKRSFSDRFTEAPETSLVHSFYKPYRCDAPRDTPVNGNQTAQARTESDKRLWSWPLYCLRARQSNDLDARAELPNG
jgi:hypothetical protein